MGGFMLTKTPPPHNGYLEDRWIRPKLTALSANMRGMFRSFGHWPSLEVPALEETRHVHTTFGESKGHF
jgi:hypothetical protein